jgi:glutathione S-transferase
MSTQEQRAKPALQLTLISHVLCPYVQRAVIALEELDMPYKRIDIDLNSPPEWFLQLSPLGKVPVLVVNDDVVLFESSVIAEYINDIAQKNLLSNVAIDKARERAWIEFASATLDNIGQAYNAGTEKKFFSAIGQLDIKWQQLEKNTAADDFFGGDKFSLVDAAYAPVFRYLDTFEQLVDVNFLQHYPRVANWRQSLSQRSSAINAVRSDYPTLLVNFISKRDSYLAERATNYLANRVAA